MSPRPARLGFRDTGTMNDPSPNLHLGSTRGQLLVATPPLDDPNFDRTVVLILEHQDSGAIGVVLNRSTHAPVESVLAEWAEHSAPPGTIFRGGPVSVDSLIGLAEVTADTDPEAHRIELSVGTLTTVDLAAPASTSGRTRIFAGYSGWGPGQLEGELAASAWLVLPAELSDVLTTDPDHLWRTVLSRQGGRVAWLATAPDDLSAN